jgi:hypothetical protein
MALTKVSFKTKSGKRISFTAGHARKGSKTPNRYAKFVKSFAKDHKNLSGPSLIKSAAKEWKKSHGKTSAKRTSSKKSCNRGNKAGKVVVKGRTTASGKRVLCHRRRSPQRK